MILGAREALLSQRIAYHSALIPGTSPQYIRAHGEPRVPADLAQHNCLTFSYSTGDRTWRFTRAGQNEQVRVRGNLRANHSETLKEAALAGLALQLLFCFEVRALGGGLVSSTP